MREGCDVSLALDSDRPLCALPTLCSSSAASHLCATLMALILRGCVQMMFVSAPLPSSIACSRMNCGSCVVFPHPAGMR